jgi:4-hydroxy-3-methylbut-2-enyl diphosphate reductase IspH
MPSTKGPIRVAGASGGYTDRQRAIHDLAKECDVDVITGGESSKNVNTVTY